MGLMRKSLHVASAGAVAPRSAKQRVARQTLAAVQGGTPAQVRRAGGRYEHSLGTLFGGLGSTTYVIPAWVQAERSAVRAANEAAWQAAYERDHAAKLARQHLEDLEVAARTAELENKS